MATLRQPVSLQIARSVGTSGTVVLCAPDGQSPYKVVHNAEGWALVLSTETLHAEIRNSAIYLNIAAAPNGEVSFSSASSGGRFLQVLPGSKTLAFNAASLAEAATFRAALDPASGMGTKVPVMLLTSGEVQLRVRVLRLLDGPHPLTSAQQQPVAATPGELEASELQRGQGLGTQTSLVAVVEAWAAAARGSRQLLEEAQAHHQLALLQRALAGWKQQPLAHRTQLTHMHARAEALSARLQEAAAWRMLTAWRDATKRHRLLRRLLAHAASVRQRKLLVAVFAAWRRCLSDQARLKQALGCCSRRRQHIRMQATFSAWRAQLQATDCQGAAAVELRAWRLQTLAVRGWWRLTRYNAWCRAAVAAAVDKRYRHVVARAWVAWRQQMARRRAFGQQLASVAAQRQRQLLAAALAAWQLLAAATRRHAGLIARTDAQLQARRQRSALQRWRQAAAEASARRACVALAGSMHSSKLLRSALSAWLGAVRHGRHLQALCAQAMAARQQAQAKRVLARWRSALAGGLRARQAARLAWLHKLLTAWRGEAERLRYQAACGELIGQRHSQRALLHAFSSWRHAASRASSLRDAVAQTSLAALLDAACSPHHAPMSCDAPTSPLHLGNHSVAASPIAMPHAPCADVQTSPLPSLAPVTSATQTTEAQTTPAPLAGSAAATQTQTPPPARDSASTETQTSVAGPAATAVAATSSPQPSIAAATAVGATQTSPSPAVLGMAAGQQADATAAPDVMDEQQSADQTTPRAQQLAAAIEALRQRAAALHAWRQLSGRLATARREADRRRSAATGFLKHSVLHQWRMRSIWRQEQLAAAEQKLAAGREARAKRGALAAWHSQAEGERQRRESAAAQARRARWVVLCRAFFRWQELAVAARAAKEAAALAPAAAAAVPVAQLPARPTAATAASMFAACPPEASSAVDATASIRSPAAAAAAAALTLLPQLSHVELDVLRKAVSEARSPGTAQQHPASGPPTAAAGSASAGAAGLTHPIDAQVQQGSPLSSSAATAAYAQASGATVGGASSSSWLLRAPLVPGGTSSSSACQPAAEPALSEALKACSSASAAQPPNAKLPVSPGSPAEAKKARQESAFGSPLPHGRPVSVLLDELDAHLAAREDARRRRQQQAAAAAGPLDLQLLNQGYKQMLHVYSKLESKISELNESVAAVKQAAVVQGQLQRGVAAEAAAMAVAAGAAGRLRAPAEAAAAVRSMGGHGGGGNVAGRPPVPMPSLQALRKQCAAVLASSSSLVQQQGAARQRQQAGRRALPPQDCAGDAERLLIGAFWL